MYLYKYINKYKYICVCVGVGVCGCVGTNIKDEDEVKRHHKFRADGTKEQVLLVQRQWNAVPVGISIIQVLSMIRW